MSSSGWGHSPEPGSVCRVSCCPQGQSLRERAFRVRAFKGPAKGFSAQNRASKRKQRVLTVYQLGQQKSLASFLFELWRRGEENKILDLFITQTWLLWEIFSSPSLPDLETSPCLPPPQAAAQHVTNSLGERFLGLSRLSCSSKDEN